MSTMNEVIVPDFDEMHRLDSLLVCDVSIPEVLCANPTKDWPYCNAAKSMSSAIMAKADASAWDELHWRRRLETFGDRDQAVFASGPNGEIDNVWYYCSKSQIHQRSSRLTFLVNWANSPTEAEKRLLLLAKDFVIYT